jgi:beta-fructofuranosidase
MKVRTGEFTRVYDPSAGERERWYVNDHTFVRDGAGTWHLFGITHAEPAAPFDEHHLAHATAPALHGPWTKHPFALSVDRTHDESVLWAPHVVQHEGLYYMFVCGGGPGPQTFRIQLAVSRDCWHWERAPECPLVVDGYEARDPMVCRIDGRWVMYYTATESPAGGRFVVVATESDDLRRWRGRRIVYADTHEGTGGGPCESPFVVARRGHFYLFIGPDWDGLLRSKAATGRYDRASYRRTRVLESEDPFAFSIERLAGTLDAHAAEVVVDDDGAEWVSHCGWGQGGVYLARLDWHGD